MTCLDICSVLTEFIDSRDFKVQDEFRTEPSISISKPLNEQATFGAGCFWGVEHLFRKKFPSIKTVVGFMSCEENISEDPSYEELCSGDLGHVEVVQITFNP